MEKKATRDALGAEVLALGLEHKDVFVIDCDVAKSCKTLEFAAKLPEQHINVGISEQNAVGIAAGLATTKSTVCCNLCDFWKYACSRADQTGDLLHKIKCKDSLFSRWSDTGE